MVYKKDDVNSRYNERYTIYAHSRNSKPHTLIEQDRKKYPGNALNGYILWKKEGRRQFAIKHPELMFMGCICDQDEFTRFLKRREDGVIKKEN